MIHLLLLILHLGVPSAVEADVCKVWVDAVAAQEADPSPHKKERIGSFLRQAMKTLSQLPFEQVKSQMQSWTDETMGHKGYFPGLSGQPDESRTFEELLATAADSSKTSDFQAVYRNVVSAGLLWLQIYDRGFEKAPALSAEVFKRLYETLLFHVFVLKWHQRGNFLPADVRSLMTDTQSKLLTAALW